jgi:acetyl-CoA carboxylase biotin carboxyl carrier protein
MSETTASALAEEHAGTPRRQRGKGRPNKPGQPTKASLNMAELRELAELVNEHGFTDFEFENENIRVRLSKTAATPVYHQALPVAPVAVAAQPAAAETVPEAAGDPDAGLHKITSPIVGTFYRAPGPDKDPYVREGDKVSENSVVCIVEAMKLMNEIQAEVTGEVVRIYVENGQPVEFGQPLFGIKR